MASDPIGPPPAGAARVNACPWCRSTDATPAWPGAEPSDFQVRRCGGCEHHYTVPVLGPDEIGAYYQEAYYGTTNRRFNPIMEWLVGRFRDRRAKALERFVQPGKVLDVGCGRGLTLASLRKRGWTTRGCELSETSARHAREVLGLDVDCDGFNPARYADGEFDAVSLWHVYEHLSDARTALETCARILRPGGVLALAVPNFDSYQARWTRYAWFHLDMPRHYSHFSAPWLRARFRELGFRVAAESHTSLEQNPYGWIQSMLNRWGLRRNLLYDVLRRGAARSVRSPWQELPMQSLLSVAGAGVLLPWSLAMLPIEGATQRGATVEFYAVREST